MNLRTFEQEKALRAFLIILIGFITAMPYKNDMHTVLLTPTFEKQVERAGLGDDEVREIVSFLAANPMAGDIIKGSGGARKVRFARSGEGKSGGYRTIHYFAGDDVPLFLLGLIDKRKSANLSKEDLNALTALLGRIAEAYRKGKKL